MNRSSGVRALRVVLGAAALGVGACGGGGNGSPNGEGDGGSQGAEIHLSDLALVTCPDGKSTSAHAFLGKPGATMTLVLPTAGWCPFCITEAMDLAARVPEFTKAGGYVVSVLAEGATVRVPATAAECNQWAGKTPLPVAFEAQPGPFRALFEQFSLAGINPKAFTVRLSDWKVLYPVVAHAPTGQEIGDDFLSALMTGG